MQEGAIALLSTPGPTLPNLTLYYGNRNPDNLDGAGRENVCIQFSRRRSVRDDMGFHRGDAPLVSW